MKRTSDPFNRDVMRRIGISLLALSLLASLQVSSLVASEIETYSFEKVWWRTDLPVQTDRAERTWVWGPEPISSLILEPYDEGNASGTTGARWVQYFDKTRVELTNTNREEGGELTVTNGLLASELITGRMKIGDHRSVEYKPAEINVAGDASDATAPTYRSLNRVLDAPPLSTESPIQQTIDRDGNVGEQSDFAGQGVYALRPVDSLDHSIASVFWEFMTAEGTIYDGFDFVDGRLFEDPFFATGLPITEPYWTTVRVGGEPRNVLIQAFQRRVLTYTPENPAGWRVEAGNVGRHYHQWRYTADGDEPLRVGGISTRRDLSENLILMGEIENSARAAFGEVQVELELLDEAGEPIGLFSTYLDAALIEAGERLPFQVWTEYQGGFADYRVSVNSRPSPRFSRPDIDVDISSATWASNSRYEIEGTIRNASGEPLEYLQFVVALYDQDGQVVDYHWGMVDRIVLAPDEVTTFDTFFFDPGRFSDYKVFVSN